METTTIIAIIIGIITVITVVVVIVIQNKRPTPSTPTTDCEWVEGKWEIDNNAQMNLQDNNNPPKECSDVTGNCGNWTRDVTCAPYNGVGNCTDNDCNGSRPVDSIQCRPCSNPTPTDDTIRVGDKVNLLYYSAEAQLFTNFLLYGRYITDNPNWYGVLPLNILPLTVFVEDKKRGDKVTQGDTITLKTMNEDNAAVLFLISRYDNYFYMVDHDTWSSDQSNNKPSYITKFHITTKEFDAKNDYDDDLKYETDYILQDALYTTNYLYNKSYDNGYVQFQVNPGGTFDYRIIRLEKVV